LKGALAAIRAEATELEFCGLTLTLRADRKALTVSAGKLIADLWAKVSHYPAPPDALTPLKGSAVQELREPPTQRDPLMDDAVVLENAMSIVGLGGWIVQACRADATLPFIAFAQQLSVNFKKSTWRQILRWAHYLINTAEEMVMTFTVPQNPGAWRASSDSSSVNALDEEGFLGPSFAAWTLHFDGSAPFDHGCMVLRGLGHATAHSELRAMVYVAKIAMGLRMLVREMGWEVSGPTILLGDSKAALEGSLLDKLKRQERFLAAQKAMLRLWVRSKVLRFIRVPGYALRPDINTKSSFTAADFGRQAHWVQGGVPYPDDKLLLDAEARLQSALAEPTRVNLVGLSDEGISNSTVRCWDDPFPAYWEHHDRVGVRQTKLNESVASVAEHRAEAAGCIDSADALESARRQEVQFKRVIRKQEKQLRAHEVSARSLTAQIGEQVRLAELATVKAANLAQQVENEAVRTVSLAAEEVRAARHVASTLTGQLKAALRK